MIVKLNVAVLRFLKTFVLFSILLFLASVIPVEGAKSSLNIGVLATIVLQILLLSVINLLPEGWIKSLSKFGAIILGLAVFSLTIYESYLSALINGKIADSQKITNNILWTAIYVVVYFICLVSSFGSLESDMKDPRFFHENNVQAFKKRMLVMGVLLGILLTVTFIIDQVTKSKLVESYLMTVMLPIILIIVSSLLLVRFSRDAIYLGVKNVSLQKMIVGYIVFGSATLGATTLLIVFRKRLDIWWAWVITAISTIIQTFKRLWLNLAEYIARIKGQSYTPITNDEFAEVMLNFGIPKDKLDNNLKDLKDPSDGLGGDIGDFDLGGIGAISGIFGGTGGVGGFLDNAGEIINVVISENGKFGSAPNGGTGNSAVVLSVKPSHNTENIYLKLKSFGDYNGKGFDDAEPYTGKLTGDYGMNYLSGYVLEQSQTVNEISLDIKSFTGQYFLPDYMSTYNNLICSNDIMLKGTTTVSYTVWCYDNSGVFNNFTTLEGKMQSAVEKYNQYVKEVYCALPEQTREQAREFAEENNISFYLSAKKCVEAVQNVFSEYTYSLDYDRTLDQQEDVVMSFLNGYSNKEGICQHFAGSTVVLLRAMDIPARYVGGMHVGELTAGEWHNVTANAAHAWVEVYFENTGWVRIDPTSFAQKAEDTFEHVYDEKEYQDLVEQFTGIIDNGGGGNGGGGNGGNNGNNNLNPGESTDPVEPEIPDVPGFPTDPEDPSDKEDPEDPKDPSDKEDPEDPKDPSDKEDPEDPKDPSDKEDPEDPKDPTDKKEPDSGEDELPNPNEQEKEDEKESVTEEKKDEEDADFPWLTVGIVAGSLVVAAVFTTLLLIYLKKRKKPTTKQLKEKIKEKEDKRDNKNVTEEESKTAKAIIRENYKQFIRIAGKNGIRKVKSDTTHSLREKYNNLISPDEAMDILTGLYRNARYNKNEKLSMVDADISYNCLQIIELAIKTRTKQI